MRWRAFSLAIKNRGVDDPEHSPRELAVALAALRVVEATWAELGDEPIGRLYTEIGQRFHVQDDMTTGAVEAALVSCGLDRTLVTAADDDRWDREIEGSMADAAEVVGTEVGVPVMVFHDDDDDDGGGGGVHVHGIHGPIMSSAPMGDEALALWDDVIGLSRRPNVFELKRPRTSRPRFD